MIQNAFTLNYILLSNVRSLEKVRPKVPKELVEACSNAVADARELKSAASFIFKADGALITKVPPPNTPISHHHFKY
jgi:hypothetical protein